MRSLRTLVVLLTPILCGAYNVSLVHPTANLTYQSIVDRKTLVDDVRISRDLYLDVFPCSGSTRVADAGRLNISIAGGYLSGSLIFEEGGLVDESMATWDQPVEAWEMNYGWGLFEDAPFEDDRQQAYAWEIGMMLGYRRAGNGTLCAPAPILPYVVYRLGDREGVIPEIVDLDKLVGTKATLAVRYSHYDLDADLEDPELRPKYVKTQCVDVRFTDEDVEFGEICDIEDIVVSSPLDSFSAPSESSIGAPSSSAAHPWPTSEDGDGNYYGGGYYDDISPPSSYVEMHGGVVAGITIFCVLGLFLSIFGIMRFHTARVRKAAAANAIELGPVNGNGSAGPRQPPADPDVVLVPAPAYMARRETDLPQYGELPPRYEDVSQGGPPTPAATSPPPAEAAGRT